MSSISREWCVKMVRQIKWLLVWPLYPTTTLKALLLTGVAGIVAACFGYKFGAQFATLLGLGLTAASLLLALLLSVIQGHQLAEQSKQLGTVATQIHKVLFNDVTMRVFYNIQANDKLSQRMHEGNIDVKDKLGFALRAMSLNQGETDFLGEFIVKRNVFIESGSTYAYLSLAINAYLNDKGQEDWPRRIICTNNILVFMVLVFQPKCRARLYPGTPAGKYGATYGTGYKLAPSKQMEFFGVRLQEMEHFLDGQAQQSIAGDSKKAPDDSDRQYAVEVTLLAASKLHLKYGPHVGSNENICFKKALLKYCSEREVPILMFVDSTKVEFAHEEVGKDCRMLYSADEESPHFEADVAKVGQSPCDTGFDRFACDIAEGRIFLFVGYNKAAEKPLEVTALEKRFDLFNATVANQKELGALVTYRTEQSQKVDMLVVFASSLESQADGGWMLSKEIQRSIATRVSGDRDTIRTEVVQETVVEIASIPGPKQPRVQLARKIEAIGNSGSTAPS